MLIFDVFLPVGGPLVATFGKIRDFAKRYSQRRYENFKSVRKK